MKLNTVDYTTRLYVCVWVYCSTLVNSFGDGSASVFRNPKNPIKANGLEPSHGRQKGRPKPGRSRNQSRERAS
jgi:hypothetical protein